MLYEILKTIHNFFPLADEVVRGKFKIESGSLTLSFLKEKQYFLIEGSVFNNGVHQYTDELVLDDEEFYGTITPLAIPKEFLNLVTEIEDYVDANGSVSPYESESFGGYSYTKAKTSKGNIASWQNVFATRLNGWRKM